MFFTENLKNGHASTFSKALKHLKKRQIYKRKWPLKSQIFDRTESTIEPCRPSRFSQPVIRLSVRSLQESNPSVRFSIGIENQTEGSVFTPTLRTDPSCSPFVRIFAPTKFLNNFTRVHCFAKSCLRMYRSLGSSQNPYPLLLRNETTID